MDNKEFHKDLLVLTLADQKSWLAWLRKNHQQTESVWLKFAKKHSGFKTVTYEEAREGALIYGWIDGLINKLDHDYYLTKFTPRRPKSNWSKINRGIAEQLIADGKMKPTGLAQVNAAKEDGRWEAAYDSSSTIQPPKELLELLESDPTAKQNFSELNQANRYAFLYRIHTSKREPTKRKHIEKAFEMLKKGEVYHPTKKSTKLAKKKK